VSFIVVVPEPLRNEISSWGLSIDAELLLYERLESDLADGHEDKLPRLAAPSPTYIYDLEFQDPLLLGIRHYCTFWLTYGELDNALYVRQCTHKQVECWDS
jgi:hypothetical protein